MSRQVGGAPQNAAATAMPPSIPLDRLSLDDFRILQKDYAVLFHKGGRDAKRIAEGKTYQDRGFDAIAQERVNDLWDELFERRQRPFPNEHLKQLQEIVYIERTINFHSATTRYQGDASLVHRHPDQILGDPDLHIPVGYCATRREVDVDDEVEDDEYDLSGTRRSLWLWQFDAELSAFGLKELQEGRLSPLDIWDLPRGDERLQFHPAFDGDDDDDTDVEEEPRYGSLDDGGRFGEGGETLGGEVRQEDDFDFEYKTPPPAVEQLAILAAEAGARDELSPAPEQADRHQAVRGSSFEGGANCEESYGGGADIEFFFDSDTEVARDLGIGTSANPPPPLGTTLAISPLPFPPHEPGPEPDVVEAPPQKKKTTRKPRATAFLLAADDESAELDPKKGKGMGRGTEEPTPRKQPPVEDLAPLKKTTTRTAPANMAYRPRTRGKRTRTSNRVYAPRTSCARVQLVRSVNCFSEDRLAAAFPAAAAATPKPSRLQRNRKDKKKGWIEPESDGEEAAFASGDGDFKHFMLNNFRVLRTKEIKQEDTRTTIITSASVDLMEVVMRTRRDLVIIGWASPMASASETDDQGPDPATADLEVHLFGYEVQAAKLTADGIVVETMSRKYRLATAALRMFAPEQPTHCEHTAKAALCPARIASSYGIPYEEQTQLSRRILNLFVFARSRSIRGNHTKPRASEDEVEEAVAKLARDVMDELAVARNAGDDSWQQRLSPYWRIPVSNLTFDESQDGHSLFHLLPNIPFILPVIYRQIESHFSPNSFRTDNVERQKELMRIAKEQKAALLSRCFAAIEEDQNYDGADMVELLGKPQQGFRLTETDRDGDRADVEVYSRAKVNQILYKSGDVVLVRRSARPHEESQQDDSVSVEGSSDDGEDSDSASVASHFDPTEDVDDRLWLAKIQYFYTADVDDDMNVHVHLQWFARGSAVPSVGDYLDWRQLVLLDRCDNSPACIILAKLEVVFPAVGEQPPSDKFYCLTQYNCHDGSYKDVATARRAGPLCDAERLYPCNSCETTLEYLAGTAEAEAEAEAKGAPRPAVAIRLDGGFLLSGISYHYGDFVYLLPHEAAAIAANEPGVLPPFDLAQFVAVHDEMTDERGELILRLRKVERVSHDALGSKGLVEVTDREIYSAAIEVAGKFFVYAPPDEDNIEAFVARLESASEHAFWTRTAGISQCGPCQLDFEEAQALKARLGQAMEKTARARTGKTSQHVELAHLAVYAGGGLLDYGLEKGCSLVRVRHAVEHHGPALSCLRSNALHALSSYEDAASNLIERLYYRLADPEGQEDQDELPQPGSVFSIAGGSPCQGFSHANRYKQADDPRTFEPFVFLNYVAIYRPLVALFENVAAFTRHALPEAGSKPGSFFQLFVTVLLELGYQLRWSIVDAAGYGVPQHRRRVVVQIAARGVPLPEAPEPSHSLRRAVKQVDHRLLTDRKSSRLDRTSENWAPHAPVSVEEAWSDLPAFSVYEMQAGVKKFGFGWDAAQPPPYATPAQSTYQRAMRLEIPPDPTGELTYNSGVTFHLCHSLSDVVVARVKALKLRDDQKGEGSHADLKGLVCYPPPPPWVTAKKSKLAKWWRRLKPPSILAPLRTKLNIDGASHGERIHYSQARPPTLRECLRAMGVPDWYELNFPSDVLDKNLEESMRIIGNGVPVPLARAFGAAFFDVLAPIADAWSGDGNVWSDLWHKINGNLVTRAVTLTDTRDSSTHPPSPAARVPPALHLAAARPLPRSNGSSGSMYATTSTPFAAAVETETGPVKSKKGPAAGPNGAGPARRSTAHDGTDTDSDDEVEIVSRPPKQPTSSSSGRSPAKQVRPDVIELSDSDTDVD